MRECVWLLVVLLFSHSIPSKSKKPPPPPLSIIRDGERRRRRMNLSNYSSAFSISIIRDPRRGIGWLDWRFFDPFPSSPFSSLRSILREIGRGREINSAKSTHFHHNSSPLWSNGLRNPRARACNQPRPRFRLTEFIA
jgi:hypothetical protein